MDKVIVEQSRKPTAYLEDVIFQLVQGLKPPPLDVAVVGGVVSIDLSLASQFNVTVTSDFTLDIINASFAIAKTSGIEFYNAAGAFDLTENVRLPFGLLEFLGFQRIRICRYFLGRIGSLITGFFACNSAHTSSNQGNKRDDWH